ncbi:response regulator [bacterium]|nr:response regulator [bacterium]
MTNPRWHLVRANRLSEAARVPDPPELLEINQIPRSLGRSSEPPPEYVSNVPRPDPRGFRIALVDDDKVTLTILAGTLRRRGYRVRTFQDPEQALDVLSRDHPDVAICDMQMPGITGLELVQRLQERTKSRPFPVMILSSEGDEKILAEAYHWGVTDYLVKPVGEAELVVKLEQAAARQRSRLPEAIPRELGGYELQDEVRRGEAAVVFRAVRVLSPDTVRAVKVLRPDVAGETEPVLKLRREIDVLAACDHPSIPRLLASGLVGRLLYYVSDDVVPKTLGEHVREKGRLSPSHAARLLREIGEALKHLHSRRFLHGDITPETIGLKESGLYAIAEMGSARWLGSPPRDDEAVPAPSRYTAPELADGQRRPDPRSDLYALGICTLDSLTGRPGSAIDDPKLAQMVPPELASILVRLVARTPEARFPDGASLLAALAALPDLP